ERQIREHAEIVGHRLEWKEEVPSEVAEGDRRWSPEKVEAAARVAATQPQPRALRLVDRLRRALNRARPRRRMLSIHAGPREPATGFLEYDSTMRLAELVAASRAVSGSSGRLAKIGHLADILRRTPPDEIAVVVGFLSGQPRQGRLGIGGAQLAAMR